MPCFVRDLFTGELREVAFEGVGRKVIAREDTGNKPQKTYGNAWSRPHKSRSLAIHPLQVDQFNADAQKAGTGVHYDREGYMVSDSRGALNRELARRGYGNADAGYGDRPPGG